MLGRALIRFKFVSLGPRKLGFMTPESRRRCDQPAAATTRRHGGGDTRYCRYSVDTKAVNKILRYIAESSEKANTSVESANKLKRWIHSLTVLKHMFSIVSE